MSSFARTIPAASDLVPDMSVTRTSWHINAPRAVVYRALLAARAVAKWKAPDGMTCHVQAFDAREGGSCRMSRLSKWTSSRPTILR
jgi:uncharacterized protein YndB with AHSA1/START domain